MQRACELYDIVHSDSDTKTMLWDLLSKHIGENVNPIVVQIALDEGNEVVFSPPHHSDLQPIELVWDNVKGTVGMQYTTETTFTDVFYHLRSSFEELQSSTVAGCIRKANKHLDELWEHIQIVYEMEEEEYEYNDEHQ